MAVPTYVLVELCCLFKSTQFRNIMMNKHVDGYK